MFHLPDTYTLSAMRPATLLQLLLPLLTLPSTSNTASNSQQKPPGKNAILLSRVHSLTLRGGQFTTAHRVSAVPQLKCVGPSKRTCGMYQIDSMRCTNEGYGYDEEDVQWTCTASLPGEFKLGSTDVICEGYRNGDDPWVLKGSCGVEYRLLLTELGEEKFGQGSFDENTWWRDQRPGKLSKFMDILGNIIFFGIFIGVFLLILWSCLFGERREAPQHGRRWGWGGGGGGDGGYPGGPPPPYSSHYYSSDTSSQGWRPGFWSGALAGGGVGYGLGRRSDRDRSYGGGRRRDYGSGEGSSSSASRFSSPSTSTGFGSTSRR
ncbi:hypothetical protein BJX99DRAFT_220075 [Aspergillus californicus]